jgi:hypothetical protein
MTRPIVRKATTGEAGNKGQFGSSARTESEAALTAVDALVEDGWTKLRYGGAGFTLARYHEVTGTPAFAELREYDGAENLVHAREFDIEGRPVSDRTYDTDGKLDNAADGTAALRTWKDGDPETVAYVKNGVRHDPGNGVPALTIRTDGMSLTLHYAHDIVQDPKPGVPAHVLAIDGKMTRKTFYTQGQVSKQVDEVALDIGGGRIAMTTTESYPV